MNVSRRVAQTKYHEESEMHQRFVQFDLIDGALVVAIDRVDSLNQDQGSMQCKLVVNQKGYLLPMTLEKAMEVLGWY